MASETSTQRLRLTFAKGEAVRYISHLDLARALERAFRRAGLPLVYSQGFSPRPKFALGAALPVGVTGRAEVMDIWLSPPLQPVVVAQRLAAQMPRDMAIRAIRQVDLDAPALQAAMRWAEYLVALGAMPQDLDERVCRFLAAEHLPRTRLHKGQERAYDLRPLVDQLRVVADDGPALFMRLANSSTATGRVDEVLAELGLSDMAWRAERIKLVWEM